MNERVKVLTGEKELDEQGGFRVGTGCVDQVFVVRQVEEKTIEKDKKMYMAFDLEKARDKLWKVLEEYEVKGRLLSTIQALYEGGMAFVKVGECISDVFNVCKGVRQGCTFSPWLFNVFINKVVREAKRNFAKGVKLPTGELGVLLFADDMVLMSDTVEGLESNLKVMSQVLSRWELKVNWMKTRVMMVARQEGRCEVKVGDEEIEQVDEMKYLGV